MGFEPKNDGIDHINMYTKGQTELGRALTNLSPYGFIHPEFGKFSCMEGFWYYYLTGCVHEVFKNYNGFNAKKEGKKLRDERIDKDGLSNGQKEVLKEAIRCKMRQNKNLLKQLIDNTLPLTHYYFYGTIDNPKVTYLDQYEWINDLYNEIRAACVKSNWRPA